MSDESFSFHLRDLLNKGGTVKEEVPEHVSPTPDSNTVELNSEQSLEYKKFADDLGLNKDDDFDTQEKVPDSEPEKKSKTLHLKEKEEKVKRPTSYERQLKALTEQQDSRIKALESALIEKQKKEETLRKVGQELYKYGSLKDQETIEREEYILNEQLKDSIHAGDVDRQVEITNKLGNLVAQKAKLNSSLPEYLSDPQEEENYFGDQYYNAPAPEVENHNKEFDEWYNASPWLKIPHLKNKAADIMENLDGELALNGKMDMIGTRQYFQEVDKRVKSHFNKSKMQSSGKYGTQPPIPVNNGGSINDVSSEYEEREPWRKIQLTADEIDSAVRVLGFQEQQRGKPLTKAQKIERMQKHLYNARKYTGANEEEPITLW